MIARPALLLVITLLAAGLPGLGWPGSGAAVAGPDAQGHEACGLPADLPDATEPLPATARAIRADALRILVAGSASVLGPGTSGPAAAWPARLEALLRQQHPGLRVTTTVRGARGLTAADMAGIIETELARTPPDLVLWQTGTVEAVRGLDPDELSAALNGGIERLRAAAADTVLIDPQFSRFFRANANVDPYLDALRLVASAHGLPLLRRYELMRLWAEGDRIDLERAPRPDRIKVTDLLNECIARAMANLIAEGVAAAHARGAAAGR